MEEYMALASEVLCALRPYGAQLKRSDDEGYDWLDEDEVCVSISNPYVGKDLNIRFNIDGPIMFFGDAHWHFEVDASVEAIARAAKDILEKRTYIASLIFNGSRSYLLRTDKRPIRRWEQDASHVLEAFPSIPEEPYIRKCGGKVVLLRWDKLVIEGIPSVEEYRRGEEERPEAIDEKTPIGKNEEKEGKLPFVYVCFAPFGREYVYLAYEDIYRVGDNVFVPVGAEKKPTFATVVRVEYAKPEEAPYPVEKIKHVLGLADE